MQFLSNRTTTVLSALLVVIVLAGCSAGNRATDAPGPTDMAINEKDGPVFEEEQRVYADLKELGVMVPDSVVVIQDEIFHGYVDRINAPRTVHLGTQRAKYPDTEIGNKFPYLFARMEKPSQSVFRKYVAVHELAHVQAAHLNAEMGRPAKGLHTRSNETQADIIALVYLNHLYGLTYEDLGYPAKVDYPMIPDKPVPSLHRLYCHIVKSTWNVEEMTCQRNQISEN